MSNIPEEKQVIYSKKDHLMVYDPGTNKVTAHTRQYDDGQATDVWDSTDCGAPFETVRAFPGLRETLKKLL